MTLGVTSKTTWAVLKTDHWGHDINQIQREDRTRGQLVQVGRTQISPHKAIKYMAKWSHYSLEEWRVPGDAGRLQAEKEPVGKRGLASQYFTGPLEVQLHEIKGNDSLI